jgi:Ca-activated chloride channel family protein
MRRLGEIINRLDLSEDGTFNDYQVRELVQISKRYGILTPYTTFLTLVSQSLDNEDELVEKTKQNLQNLKKIVGQEANWQRQYKRTLAAAAALEPTGPSGLSSQDDLKQLAKLDLNVSNLEELKVPIDLADKTFFYKNGYLIDSSLSPSQITNPVKAPLFSEEYFKLGLKLEGLRTSWLAQKEPIIFKFNGQAYLIEK